MNRETRLLLTREASAFGASVQVVARGRHGQALQLTLGECTVTIPVAGSTGHGKARHTLNAVAQVRRILRTMAGGDR